MWEIALLEGVNGQPILDGMNLDFQISKEIQTWIKKRGAEFVTNCTTEQKDAIAMLLSKKMRDTHTVDELSRMIRPCIGLTKGQVQSNVKLYDHIISSYRKEHPKMKMDAIKRKALDATLKYAERQHRERAMTIAETESAFAYNKGADEGIRQAQEQNLIGNVIKRWSTSGDDAVCRICSDLEGTEIRMDDDFEFKGNILFSHQHRLPPAHPRCACAVEYIEI
jgi:hypothetical protein